MKIKVKPIVTKVEPGPNEVRFQKFAFDPDLSRSHRNKLDISKLSGAIDTTRDGVNVGFQQAQFRTGYAREIPAWARSDADMQTLLLTVFRRLHRAKSQRQRAGRWALVGRLYFVLGYSREEICNELSLTDRSVRSLIDRISRQAEDLFRERPSVAT